MQSIRAWWLLLAFLSGVAAAMWVEELVLHTHENRLEFTTPVHFLTGPSLARLKNADEVPFDIQVTLWTDNHKHVFRSTADRFVISFDLWEESFSVVKTQAPRKSASHLNAPGAEAWCLKQMSMDENGLSATEPFWARLEIRAEDSVKDPRDPPLFGRGNIGDSGISLTSLIEIFSRPARAEQPHWSFDAGPVTLNDLKRSSGRS